ncbi:MAG: biotin transporter BioY [Phaeodactylibacter sp.]|uniref:biotin transporter BioY n=1 Tax=Phaeodactylibacter sp. TaxID=1940289 RepID=UPI0032EB4D49
MTTHLINLALSLLFLALMAQLSIQTPEALGGIPITGQSLAVLLVGFLLPFPWGGGAVLLYLLLGGLGLPVFAEGGSGWSSFSGGSGGFLIGFFIAALGMGWLRRRGWGLHLGYSLLANGLGTAVIVGSGLLWLTYLYGWGKALEYGFYPFWPGAIVKILLGGFIAWSMLRKRRAV